MKEFKKLIISFLANEVIRMLLLFIIYMNVTATIIQLKYRFDLKSVNSKYTISKSKKLSYMILLLYTNLVLLYTDIVSWCTKKCLLLIIYCRSFIDQP